jgi:hypothetical protein
MGAGSLSGLITSIVSLVINVGWAFPGPVAASRDVLGVLGCTLSKSPTTTPVRYDATGLQQYCNGGHGRN